MAASQLPRYRLLEYGRRKGGFQCGRLLLKDLIGEALLSGFQMCAILLSTAKAYLA